MKNSSQTVMGVHAPPPRPTFGAACLLAIVLSLPFALLALVQVLWP
jgi:hypothetical protein